MNRLIPAPTRAAIAPWMLLLAAIGCGQERTPTPPLQIDPHRVAAPAPALIKSTEHIASTVSAADHTQAERQVAALIARIEERPPAPHVLFSVPFWNCDRMIRRGATRDDCSAMQGLFYGYAGGELWGLGDLFVDADGRFWQSDRAVGRVVAFDLHGKQVHKILLEGPNGGVNNLWHVTADEVRIDPAEDKPGVIAIARYGLDGTFRGWSPLDMAPNRLGWSSLIRLSGEQNRFVSLDGVMDYQVADANFGAERVTFSAPSDLRLYGHRYGFVCEDSGGAQHGTLVIDDHATAVPGCGGLRHVAADGSAIIEVYPDVDPIPAALRFDSQARLIGVALGGVQEVDLGLGHIASVAIGPDGKAYSYIARKRRVDFVEVPFVAP